MTTLTSEQKDDRLIQFLGMTEDRCDIDVARVMLESCDWSLEKAVNALYDDGSSGRNMGLAAAAASAASSEALKSQSVSSGSNKSSSRTTTAGGMAAVVGGSGTGSSSSSVVRRHEGGLMTIASREDATSLFAGNEDLTTDLFAGNDDVSAKKSNAGNDVGGKSIGQQPSRAAGNPNGGATREGDSGGGLGGFFSGLMQTFSPTQPEPAAGAEVPVDAQEEADAQMARAMQESMRAGGGRESEEDQVKRLMAMTGNSAEALERNDLKFQQDMEYQESLLIDRQLAEERAKEQAEIDVVVRLQEAEEGKARAEKQAKIERVQHAVQTLPPEPPSGGLSLSFRFPSGKSVRRRFHKDTDSLDQVYAFVDGQLLELGELDVVDGYILASTFPRMQIARENVKLCDTKIENQTALVLQKLS